MSDVFQNHGAFSWCELQTDDAEKAKTFYGDVIGWETEAMEMPGGGIYTVLKAGDQPVGGILQRPPEMADQPVHWASFITVDDVDRRVAAATAGGATLVTPLFDVPGVGRMATLKDPVGAVISLITYEKKD
ncbi:VOC family protein [Pelagibius litoralis]|uniref:VOC family protein n=1 Tax=Pelagibius litoralis TaxID=374515 RepID=A0A967F2E5_9PROT|nr:VOC family protein [Pelagibius litoralis]NIA71889.1 VOC family protein [Pelagibius litoralis]